MENYQHYAEKFYDLIKLNNEFREYDFKKNLEIKTHLCEAAEKLADEEDVISAFHQLQSYIRNSGIRVLLQKNCAKISGPGSKPPLQP